MDWVQFSVFLVTMCGFWLAGRHDLNIFRSDLNSLRAEAAADRRDILQLIRSIEQEVKDFHGRLERQDAEFRGTLALQDSEFKSKLAITDAEFKSKLAITDAEFKAHLMHCHSRQ